MWRCRRRRIAVGGRPRGGRGSIVDAVDAAAPMLLLMIRRANAADGSLRPTAMVIAECEAQGHRGPSPWESCRSRLTAALIIARCVNAWGKLQSSSPLSPIFSE